MKVLPRVLMVCYGGGHVRMLLPVARALQDHGLAEPIFLGLTTARAEVLAAGWPCLGFADFVEPGDAAALEAGEHLVSQLATQAADRTESVAYLGLNWADLVSEHGEAEATRRYQRDGRQAFLPVRTLRRILERLKPDAVLATSAPRAERAALLAARQLGVASLCLVDLFAATEIEWLRDPLFADRVGVLNGRVRERLLAAGRKPEQVVVTGNPAFDAITDPQVRERGRAMRAARGWSDRCVVLWASQIEPASHPTRPEPGHPELPGHIAQTLREQLAVHEAMQLVVRPHPSEPAGVLPEHDRESLSGRTESLHELLHACDVVVVMTSTVGIEARLAGKHVIQVLGSLYSIDTPYLAYGIADQAVTLDDLPAAISRAQALVQQPGAELVQQAGTATQRVVAELMEVLA